MTFMSRQILTADALNALATAISQLQAVAPFKAAGTWDASTGAFPVGANKGDTYIVTVTGVVDGQTFTANDELVAIIDLPSTTTFAGNWLRLQGSITRAEIEAALGAALVGSAFSDTTNASNIQSGTLNAARLPAAIPLGAGSTAPNVAVGDNSTNVANTAFVAAAISALSNAAPGALDTLKELADAIGDDANFAATMTNALASKAPLASPIFTGSPTAPTPALGNNSLSIANTQYVMAAIAAAASAVSSVFGRAGAVTANAGDYTLQQIYNAPINPMGRLSVVSGVPTPTPNITNAGVIYYTPYTGQIVPIYDGFRWIATDIGGELSQATTDATKSPAACAANSHYSLFVWNDAGTIRCTRGPAWVSPTDSGTGPGTSQLQRINGILTNAQAILNGPAAGRGTYVGSITTNGSALVDFTSGGTGSGGVAAWLHVWNMYNRVDVPFSVVDNGGAYTYSAAAWRPAHNSANMSVSIMLGHGGSLVTCFYSQRIDTVATAGSYGNYGIGLDSSTSSVSMSGLVTTNSATSITDLGTVAWSETGLWGWHYFAAVEKSDGSHANNFNGGGSGSTIFGVAQL